ncbi:bifunctional homocysteine S-methyltransferase/methylenetetrahydrofolate reductase [candidate division WOR-3 bacterium]|nr:bifunctional homocysteine S-methyltransferase/methylenetetrahydrofolate reductase [candidate division WOR-3 bacterium]
MDFWERIKERVLVADGAMGTLLYERGVPKGHCYDELNLSNPTLIQEIHKAYLDAGAELIETNTFGANEYILSKYYDLGEKSKEINYRGAKIAREVARDKFVAGTVGPVTRPLESREKLQSSEIKEIFTSQILALLEGGVDLIILETMASIDELLLGFRAARAVCDLPIICQLSFAEDGRTILGVDPVEASIRLDKEKVQIIGANCGIGPQSVYESIQRMGHITQATLSAQPNAGRASWTGEKFVYPATPEYFADYAKRYVSSGVSIIGGCCGTTPAYISAIKNAVESLTPKPRKIVQINVGAGLKPTPTGRDEVTSPLQQMLKEKFVLSLELEPPKSTNVEKELLTAESFKNLGGDCVNISDNPMARLRMSPIPLAHIIQDKVDIEVILHFTCRDRNLLAIQSDLIGMHALGIQNILALTGDPPSVGDYPFATAVFEINSEGLVEIINSLNNGTDWLGNPIPNPTSFFVGVASGLDGLSRTKKKIAKGARFIQTQPIFDIENFRKFVSEFPDIPVIAGILVLGSLRQAEFIQNEVPGITIPDPIMERMKKGATDEGAIIARELLGELRKFSDGACIMIPGGKYELIKDVLK